MQIYAAVKHQKVWTQVCIETKTFKMCAMYFKRTPFETITITSKVAYDFSYTNGEIFFNTLLCSYFVLMFMLAWTVRVWRWVFTDNQLTTISQQCLNYQHKYIKYTQIHTQTYCDEETGLC